ncbi:hypothetical protein SEVIR_2G339533v4 [Setaria viridis]|uniref:Uncharacterized protein n=1 Tax=Setaria viridis TaxID=4556 RepID=A0A4U6VY51_SETVI|nr:hypothetical protein SEVIR_2G339533v2 [Setaria viridis]
MAAMARNTVLLLALVGIVVVQLCSVAPPAAAAGRALVAVDQLPCPNGTMTGDMKGGSVNGKGHLNCGGTKVVEGEGSSSSKTAHVGVAGTRV